MYQKIRDSFYRFCIRGILSSKRLQSYLHSILTREGGAVLQKLVLEHKGGAAFRGLLRGPGLPILREELDAPDGKVFSQALEAGHGPMLEKKLLENDAVRFRQLLGSVRGKDLADLFEHEGDGDLVVRLLEADGCRLLKAALSQADSRLLFAYLGADGNEAVRSADFSLPRRLLAMESSPEFWNLLAQQVAEHFSARLENLPVEETLTVWRSGAPARLFKGVLDARGYETLKAFLRENRGQRFQSVLSADFVQECLSQEAGLDSMARHFSRHPESLQEVFGDRSQPAFAEYLFSDSAEPLFNILETQPHYLDLFFQQSRTKDLRLNWLRAEKERLESHLASFTNDELLGAVLNSQEDWVRILFEGRGLETLRAALLRDEGEMALKLFEPEGATVLAALLEARGSQLLKTVLDREDQRLLKAVLTADGGARLLQVLEADGLALLHRALEGDSLRLLGSILRKDDNRLLRMALEREDRELFRELLLADQSGFFVHLVGDDLLGLVKEVLSFGQFRLFKKTLQHDRSEFFRTILAEDDAALLRTLFGEENETLFENIFLVDNGRLLKTKLRQDRCRVLKELLLADDSALLHRVLEDDHLKILKDTLLEGEATLLKSVLAVEDYRLLREALTDDDQRLLKRILHLNDGREMIAVLSADGHALLEKALDAQDGRLLMEILKADGAVRFFRALEKEDWLLFRLAVRADNFRNLIRLLLEKEREPLRLLLRVEGKRVFTEALELEGGLLIKETLLSNQMAPLKKLLVDNALFKEILSNRRLSAVVDYYREWDRLRPVVDSDRPEVAEVFDRTTRALSTTVNMHRELGALFCQDDEALLAAGKIHFPEFPAFWVLVHEILLNEDYYFASEETAPRILDCGTHFGMALYYFKTLYPNARITGFEPVPFLREMALENVRRNRFSDVEVLPYALAAEEGRATFHLSKTDTMAGSLTDRGQASGASSEEIQVECRRLSSFLAEPVHFLKLDIEGVEDAVLEEAQHLLPQVQHIFVEYHQGPGLSGDRLPRVLDILHRAGFDIHLDKSFSAHQATSNRPMTAAGNPLSLSIWGRNRNWREGSPAPLSGEKSKNAGIAKATSTKKSGPPSKSRPNRRGKPSGKGSENEK